jgi:hypothetical protein
LDNLIAEALPLPEAPPAVRSVHLYKLLCGGTLDRSSSNDLPIRAFLREETGKTSMERCEGSFVTVAPAECGVWSTSAAQVAPSEGVRIDLPRIRPPFLGYDDELNHTHESILLNENAGSQFGLVQPSVGARHFLTRSRVSKITKWYINVIVLHYILS